MVPFLDLKSQYRAIKPEVDAAVIGVLESGQFVLGPAVQAFEQSFAAAYDIPHAIGCSSGTAALHLALLAAGIGRGEDGRSMKVTVMAALEQGAIDVKTARRVLDRYGYRDARLAA